MIRRTISVSIGNFLGLGYVSMMMDRMKLMMKKMKKSPNI